MLSTGLQAAVIAFNGTFGRAGPTGPCWATSAGGSSLKSLYSSLIFTDNRSRALEQAYRQVVVAIEYNVWRTFSRPPSPLRQETSRICHASV
jgi:hypothetical protein